MARASKRIARVSVQSQFFLAYLNECVRKLKSFASQAMMDLSWLLNLILFGRFRLLVLLELYTKEKNTP